MHCIHGDNVRTPVESPRVAVKSDRLLQKGNIMTIPISQVKTICTASELALVQASRRPSLSRHTLAEAKRYATRTRKQFDKWQERVRSQSRERGRATGHSGIDNRASEKEQIFREAVTALDAQVNRLEVKGAPATPSKTRDTSKPARNRQHRAERAEVRGELSELETSRKSTSRAAAAKATPVESAPDSPPPKKVTRRSLPGAVTAPKPGSPPPMNGMAPKRQLQARSVAKQNRISESGLTTRIRGHVSARGRRSQGRKDST